MEYAFYFYINQPLYLLEFAKIMVVNSRNKGAWGFMSQSISIE